MAVDKVFVNGHSVARIGFRALVCGFACCDCAVKAKQNRDYLPQLDWDIPGFCAQAEGVMNSE